MSYYKVIPFTEKYERMSRAGRNRARNWQWRYVIRPWLVAGYLPGDQVDCEDLAAELAEEGLEGVDVCLWTAQALSLRLTRDVEFMRCERLKFERLAAAGCWQPAAKAVDDLLITEGQKIFKLQHAAEQLFNVTVEDLAFAPPKRLDLCQARGLVLGAGRTGRLPVGFWEKWKEYLAERFAAKDLALYRKNLSIRDWQRWPY